MKRIFKCINNTNATSLTINRFYIETTDFTEHNITPDHKEYIYITDNRGKTGGYYHYRLEEITDIKQIRAMNILYAK